MKYLVRLIGKNGAVCEQRFASGTEALAWATGRGLANVEGGVARAEVHVEGRGLIWSKDAPDAHQSWQGPVSQLATMRSAFGKPRTS